MSSCSERYVVAARYLSFRGTNVVSMSGLAMRSECTCVWNAADIGKAAVLMCRAMAAPSLCDTIDIQTAATEWHKLRRSRAKRQKWLVQMTLCCFELKCFDAS